MRVQKILLGVAVGWLALSLAGGAYFILSQRVQPFGAVEVRPPSRSFPSEGGSATSKIDPELAAMLYRYFPKPLSQGYEEVLIRDYFQDRRDGFLLDVGASHFRDRSTTHYLDVALGWRGIAVDAIAEFAEGYALHRPRTKYFAAFVSDRSDENVDFIVNRENSRLSTADEKTASYFKGATEVRELSTVTLDDLLDAEGVREIDLLSMDIELWEPKALAGFDIERFRPELVVIEFHEPIRDQLKEYFASHGYAQIEKYTRWDGRNAYYVPADDLAKFLARPPSS